MLVERLLSSGLLDDVYFPGLFDREGNLRPSFLYAARAWDRLRAAFEGNVEYLTDVHSAGIASVREGIFSPTPVAETRPAPFTVLSAPHATGRSGSPPGGSDPGSTLLPRLPFFSSRGG